MGSHDVHAERPRTIYICDGCQSEYTSWAAAVACEDEHLTERRSR
jgi:hypothetical protein